MIALYDDMCNKFKRFCRLIENAIYDFDVEKQFFVDISVNSNLIAFSATDYESLVSITPMYKMSMF